jgi:hypothetical protein
MSKDQLIELTSAVKKTAVTCFAAARSFTVIDLWNI